MNILLVDDDSSIRLGIRQMLLASPGTERCCYEAGDGFEAMRLLQEIPIDLALVDVRMPLMNGIRLLELAAPFYPATAFVIVSAYGEFEYAQRAMRLGAVDYLLKPLDPDELEQVVRQYAKGRSPVIEYAPSVSTGVSAAQPAVGLRLEQREALRLAAVSGVGNEAALNELASAGFWSRGPFALVVLDGGNPVIGGTGIAYEWIEAVLGSAGGYHVPGDPAIGLVPTVTCGQAIDELLERSRALGIELSIGLSAGEASAWTSLYRMYGEASRALCGRLIDPDRGLYRWEEQPAAERIWLDRWRLRLERMSQWPDAVLLERLTDELWRDCPPWLIFSGLDDLCFRLLELASASGLESFDTEDALGGFRTLRTRSEVAAYLKRIVEEIAMLRDYHSSHDYYRQVMAEAKQYIGEHLAEDISLELVARHVNMSAGHFSRLFRRLAGITFIHYVTDVRIEEGKRLLLSGRYRIYEVAEKVGYANWKHFSRLFRHKYGVTPNQFIGKSNGKKR